MARPREFDIDEALDAAMGAFWEGGYEATSMANLMEAMDLQKGSIYKAFGDKHNLFVQALDRYLDAGYGKIRHALEGAGSPTDGVKKWLCFVLGVCCEQNTRRGCFAVNAITELGPHDEGVAKRLKQHFDGIERLLANVIEQGQRRGEFRDDMSAAELSEFLNVYVTGMFTSSKGPHSKTRMRRLSDFAIQMLTP